MCIIIKKSRLFMYIVWIIFKNIMLYDFIYMILKEVKMINSDRKYIKLLFLKFIDQKRV